MILYIHVHPIGQLYKFFTQTHIDMAVATGTVGQWYPHILGTGHNSTGSDQLVQGSYMNIEHRG